MYQQRQAAQVAEAAADILEHIEMYQALPADMQRMFEASVDARIDAHERLIATYGLDWRIAADAHERAVQIVKARKAERKLMRRIGKMRWELSSRASV